MAPIVDLGMNKFKYLNIGRFTPDESFMNAYTEDNYELEQIHISNKRIRLIHMTNTKHKIYIRLCKTNVNI